jgi:hypothetical protein
MQELFLNSSPLSSFFLAGHPGRWIFSAKNFKKGIDKAKLV